MAEPDDQQRQRELSALFGGLAHAVGLQTIPLPSGEQERLMPLDEAVRTLATARYVPAPHRLEILARLTRARPTFESSASLDQAIADLADSLMVKQFRQSTNRQTLMDQLSKWSPGTEPLGRSTVDATVPDELLSTLKDSVRSMAVSFLPSCEADATRVGGVPALHIATEAITTKPLRRFKSIVNPLEWPNCWLQKDFFRSMQQVAPASPPPFSGPENGWKEVLLEVVDFGAFSPSRIDQSMQTELEFVYFFPKDPSLPGPTARAGCTYDLFHSRDGKIVVDQGYLLVEDLRPTADVRRYRTLKVVHFRDGDQPPEDVCAFWSLAAGMTLLGC